MAQVAWSVAEGLAWHAPQSNVTSAVVVGTPPDHATASCLISPEGGCRAGLAANGPTNPVGTEAAWQSPQVAGVGRPRFARAAW